MLACLGIFTVYLQNLLCIVFVIKPRPWSGAYIRENTVSNLDDLDIRHAPVNKSRLRGDLRRYKILTTGANQSPCKRIVSDQSAVK